MSSASRARTSAPASSSNTVWSGGCAPMSAAGACHPDSCSAGAVRTDAAAALLPGLLAAARPLQAQAALTEVNEQTQVRSIHFRFDGPQTLNVDDLHKQIAL